MREWAVQSAGCASVALDALDSATSRDPQTAIRTRRVSTASSASAKVSNPPYRCTEPELRTATTANRPSGQSTMRQVTVRAISIRTSPQGVRNVDDRFNDPSAL